MSSKPVALQVEKPCMSYVVQHVDTDASGVVHFSRYASLSETAALDKLDELGAGLTSFQALELDLRVRELNIRYVAPARFRDRLFLYAELKHIGVARLRILVDITVQNPREEPLVIAQAELDFAVVDAKRDSPACIPETLSNLLRG